MPEFTVTGDDQDSWRATNQISGTLLDTPLKETPFAIDVFTAGFIEDTASTDFREVLAYDSGVQLRNTLGAMTGDNFTEHATGIENDSRNIANNDTDTVIRGFRSPALKNGFFTQVRVDSANIGRIERGGGAMSLLYGIGAISGIVNVITERPLPEPRYDVSTVIGNDDFYRAAFEATGPLYSRDSEKWPMAFNYRLTAAWQDAPGKGASIRQPIPFLATETTFFAPVFSFQPHRSTSILVEFEFADRERTGTGPRDVEETRGGLAGLRDDEENKTYLQDTLGLGRFVNFSGPDARQDDSIWTFRTEIIQDIGDHIKILAAAYYEDYEFEERGFRTDNGPQLTRASRRPRVPEEFVGDDGRTLQWSWEDSYVYRDNWQTRVTAVASYEFLGGQHTFVLGRQDLSENQVASRGRSDSLRVAGLEAYGFANPDNEVTSIRYNGEVILPPDNDRDTNRWYQAHYAIYQGSWVDGRVRPVLGYRWDRVHTREVLWRYDDEGVRADEPDEDFLSGRDVVNGYSNGGVPFRYETPTLGMSVAMTDNVNIYAFYGEGINLPDVAQRDGAGEGFESTFTRSKEIGVKFDLWDNKISGRVTAFQLDKLGGVRYTFYAPNIDISSRNQNFDPSEPLTYDLSNLSSNTIDRVREFGLPTGVDISAVRWDQYADVLLDYQRWALDQKFNQGGTGLDPISYVQGNNLNGFRGAYHNFDEESEGIEVSLDVTPMANWENRLSYTYNQVLITQGLSSMVDFDLWLDQLRPEDLAAGNPAELHAVFWQLNPEFFDGPRPSTYNGPLGADVVNNDTPQHKFSWLSKYSFTEGMLEGLNLTFGARYEGSRLAQSPWSGGLDAIERAISGDNLFADVPAHWLYDLGVGYDWEMWGLDWRANLFVRNIEDKTELTATGTRLHPITGEPTVTRFYLEGRETRFSLRARF